MSLHKLSHDPEGGFGLALVVLGVRAFDVAVDVLAAPLELLAASTRAV
jgi:hypothetical protein